MKPTEALGELSRRLPEVTNWLSDDDISAGSYSALGSFALELRDRLGSLDDEFVLRVCAYLQAMGDSDDPETQNLLMVGFFEVIAGNVELAALFRNHLTGQALDLFAETVGVSPRPSAQ